MEFGEKQKSDPVCGSLGSKLQRIEKQRAMVALQEEMKFIGGFRMLNKRFEKQEKENIKQC